MIALRMSGAHMTKLLLIAGFIATLSMLGFAAANAGAPVAPDRIMVNGPMMDVSYD
jgi:hypothetical protein